MAKVFATPIDALLVGRLAPLARHIGALRARGVDTADSLIDFVLDAERSGHIRALLAKPDAEYLVATMRELQRVRAAIRGAQDHWRLVRS